MDLERLIKRGHLPGGGMRSPDRKYFYLNIPKNASTYTTNVLKDNNWQFANASDGRFEELIIIVRDPIERWISGISTYCCSYLLEYGYGSDRFVDDYNILVERLLFDNVSTFDDHTAPQTDFINMIPPSLKPRHYIWAGCDSIIEILSFLTGKLIVENENTFNNSKESNYDTEQISNFIRSRLTIPLKSKLEEAYARDYEFINSIPLLHGR
jgi:hypothetical protein